MSLILKQTEKCQDLLITHLNKKKSLAPTCVFLKHDSSTLRCYGKPITLGVLIDGETICFDLRYDEEVCDTGIHKPHVEIFAPTLTFEIGSAGVAVAF